MSSIDSIKRSCFVSPAMWVGRAPAGLEDQFTTVATAGEAVAVIRAGGRALLPMDALGEAESALTMLGFERGHVASQMRFAKLGMAPVPR